MSIKPALSRDLILQTAIKLVDERGIEKTSMRKIASLLNVTPMAIYRHFDNAEELNEYLFDLFIQRADVLPVENTDWQAWLLHVSERMYATLITSPHWLSLIGQVRLRAAAFAVLDSCLACFTEAGFSRKSAIEAFFLMLQAVMGAVYLSHSLSAPRQAHLSRDEQSRLPHMSTALPEISEVMRSDLLKQQINGLISSLRASTRKPGAKVYGGR